MEKRGIYVQEASRLNSRKPVSVQQRNTKQLMEKKRRARINSCLETLKSLVLKNTNQDISQFTKLEKADVLEMVVKYMENIQKSKSSQAPIDSENKCTRPGSDTGQGTSQSLKRKHSQISFDRRKSPKRRRVLMDVKNLPGTSYQDENSNPFSFSDSESENVDLLRKSFKKVCGFGERITGEGTIPIPADINNQSVSHLSVNCEDTSGSLYGALNGNSSDSVGSIFSHRWTSNKSWSYWDMDGDNAPCDNVNALDSSLSGDIDGNVIPVDVTTQIWRPW